MSSVGLVLQGGGMRGIYTSGVLDFFMEKDLYFPYIIGVSAGACNGCAYVSKQIGFAKKMYLDYIYDPRYINYKNVFKGKSVLGMDFIFDEIPNSVNPFDFESFKSSNHRFIVTTTDYTTGEPVYFDKDECDDIFMAIRASSSIPFITPPVNFSGMQLIDGGVSDPIPIKKSLQDGNESNVVVLTDGNYMNKPRNIKRLAYKMYPKDTKLIDWVFDMHRINNDALDYINSLECENKAIVISPSKHIKMGIVDKNRSKLEELYNLGYQDAKSKYEDIKRLYN
ncbi:patatin-like phospholipase family protein [Alkalithermobacter paradoxus]